MAEPDPLGFHERLSDEDQAKILGLNAACLLGLERT
jgi:aminocarboxymuconate-semialdehyde decarboxylase